MFTECPRINARYDDWNLITVANRLDNANVPYAFVFYIVKHDFTYIVHSFTLLKTHDSYFKTLEQFAMSCENFVRFL